MYQKDIFLKTAIVTIIVLIIGIGIGIWLDNNKVNETKDELMRIDTQWNDIRIEGLTITELALADESCKNVIESNYDFHEKILEEGYEIERREQVNKLDPNLLEQKKRYVLLQMQYWLNSINLRKQCNANYTTLIYFYSQFDENLKQKQNVQSTVLMEFIYKCKDKLVTIAIPADIDLNSVNLLKKRFSIETLPSILINEEVLLEDLQSVNELENYLKC